MIGVAQDIYPSRRYPRGRYHGPAEGGGCEQDRGQLPKAKGAKPEDFADLRFIKELDDSGYIDKLYKK